MKLYHPFFALVAAVTVALGLALSTSLPAAAQAPFLPAGLSGPLLGLPVPGVAAGTQAPATNPCPGGPQPLITSYIDSASLLPSFLSTGFLTPGFGFGGVGFGGVGGSGFGVPFVGGGVLAVDRVTEIHNFNGVQGLVLTVFSNGFSRPVFGLGVPAYLLEDYGGNLNAIQQDLAAGYLKCRTS